jgi:hypothetical protein
VRRAVAGVVLVVAVILIVIGVHSCQVSQTNSALRDYSDRVAALIQASDQTGASFFHLLSSGQGTTNPTNLQTQVNNADVTAAGQLSQAEALSVPDQMSAAQQAVVMTMRLRADGIRNIARYLQHAFNSQSSHDAVNSIAAEMARFYGSDVVYKDYALPSIITALTTATIAVGGANGEPINQGQFLPSLQWLSPTYVASQLQASSPVSTGKLAPGLHGHALNSVSVGGTTLQTGSTNNIPSTPAPTFTLNFSNTGQNTESNVVCKVAVSASVSGQTTVPTTSPGQSYNCQVALSSPPPKGSATVTATIVGVPGEKNLANNTLTFPVNFQ